jgi:hypothetical protein
VTRRGSKVWSCSFTCSVDGLDHTVSDDAVASGLAARRGIYTALCGHLVHVTALASAAGPSCQRCAQLANHLPEPTMSLHRPGQHRRRGRLRQLLRRC